MEQRPNRPFESLDWYRDAARHGFAEDQLRHRALRKATGAGVLRGHISVFAVVSVVLLVIMLLRTPEDTWANRWIVAWGVLLSIHGVCLGILWAIRQWNADDEDELVNYSDPRWKQTAMFGWGAAGSAPSPEPQEAAFRVSQPASEPEAPPSPWANWNVTPDREERPASERASWSEASPTAWMERRTRTEASETAGPKPDSNT